MRKMFLAHVADPSQEAGAPVEPIEASLIQGKASTLAHTAPRGVIYAAFRQRVTSP